MSLPKYLNNSMVKIRVHKNRHVHAIDAIVLMLCFNGIEISSNINLVKIKYDHSFCKRQIIN